MIIKEVTAVEDLTLCVLCAPNTLSDTPQPYNRKGARFPVSVLVCVAGAVLGRDEATLLDFFPFAFCCSDLFTKTFSSTFFGFRISKSEKKKEEKKFIQQSIYAIHP